jgi:hypothetical protein
MYRLVLIFIFIGIASFACAQNSAVSRSVEDLLESLGENLSDDSDIQEILDDWDALQKAPLNINSASKDDFKRLHLLSESQVDNLIAYRAKTGTIYSLYELIAVTGLNQELLQKIEPFLTFEVQENKLSGKKAATDVLLRASRALNGSDGDKYEGSPEKFYVRLKHTSQKMEFGYVGEKDPGEAFFRGSNKSGFDYNSAFINFRAGENSRLFLGDYTARFGQGLVLWQGFSMGKSAETTQIFRSAQGIRSYTSTGENQFMRGVAAQINYRNFSFSPYVSYHNVDASLDTIGGTKYFGAFQTSGYHRTNTEIKNEKSLGQFTCGSHLEFESGTWAIGSTIVFNRYNAFCDREDQPYNQFLPEGRTNLAGGINWKGSVKKVFAFGEGAISQNNGRALIAGLMLNTSSNSELSVVYRNINKTYFSSFSNAFTESSRVNDEHGLYLGFKVYPVSRIIIQAYADFFRFNWLKYTTSAPSNGTEFFAQITYLPSRKSNLYLRFFQEEKGQRLIDGVQKYDVYQLINRVRLNYSRDISERWSMKSRIEFSFYSKQVQERGFLILQDIAFHPENRPYSINGRLAYFSTDGYNSRLYAYENDLLYSFAVPAFFDEGIRAYINLKDNFGKRITFWLKIASTFNLNSGEQATKPLINTELKLQMRYRF